jgi:PAS domain S-box-containing protein
MMNTSDPPFKRKRPPAAQTQQLTGDKAAELAGMSLALLDAMPDAALLYDHLGRIHYANAAARAVFGLDAQPRYADLPYAERVAQLAPRALDGRPLAVDEWHVSRLLRGEKITATAPVEAIVTTLDGRTACMSFTGAPLRDADGELVGAVAIGRDITDRLRREAEQRETMAREQAARQRALAALAALAATKTRYRRLVDANVMGILLKGADRIYEANDVFLRMVGYTREDLEAGRLSWRAMTPPEFAYLDERALVELRERGECAPFEKEYIRKDGSHVPVLIVGTTFEPEPLRWTCFAVDLSERKALEREALERASQLEALFQAMTDAIYMIDQEGRVLQMNQAARSLLNLSQLQEYYAIPLEGRTSSTQVVDEAGEPLPMEAWPTTRILRGEVLTGGNAQDIRLRLADGHILDVSISGAPVRDAQGNIVASVAICRDVTERRQLERRTRDALDALLLMAQTLVGLPGEGEGGPQQHEPSKESDEAPASANETDPYARVRSVAQRLAVLTCEVLGCKRVGIVAVEPRTELLRAVAVVGLSPEQERQWWDEQRAPKGSGLRLGDGADPDELARFRAGEVFVVDMTEPRFRELPNPYGVTTTLVAPMRVGDSVVGVLSLDYGGPAHNFTPDEILLTGAVAQLGAVVLERERLLHERAQAQAQALALEEANRRMDEFLGVAGHELKTPLTSTTANIQLAQRRLQRLSAEMEHLDTQTRARLAPIVAPLEVLVGRVATASRRQVRLVEDLLEVSRIEAGKLELRLERVDLAAIVRESVDEQRLSNSEREVSLDLPERAAPIMADADRIGQVVTNYLTNALKYSEQATSVAASLEIEGGSALVRVRDAGPGIAQAEQGKLWERFHRVPGIDVLSGSGVGLGLGLYISREIIERHGGEVGVVSAPGDGSTFWFKLHLADE